MVRFFYTCVLVLVSLLCVRAQMPDTLQESLNRMPENRAKADTLLQWASRLREQDNVVAARLAQEAMSIAEKNEYPPGVATALEHLGWINYRKGYYTEAFDLSTKALRIFESLHDQRSVARCLNNIAAVSYERKQYDEAIASFRRAWSISTQLKDNTTAIRSLNNIAFSFLGLKALDSARHYAQHAMDLSKAESSYFSAFSLRILGDIALEERNPHKALQYLQEGLLISESSLNYFLKASTLHRIGKAYVMMNQPERAIQVLEENLSLSEKHHFADELVRTHKLMAEIYEATDRPALALRHLNQYLTLQDSLTYQRNNEQIALLQARFESELQQSKIDLLTKDSQLKSEEINRQKAWIYIYVGGFVFALVLLLVLYRSNIKFKKVNTELETKNLAVIKQTRQLQGVGITKDKLLSIISHDLRSPLNGFRGLLTLFRNEQLTPEEMKKFTQKLDQRLTVLNDDLDNLLQWTQTQLHGLQIEKGRVAVQNLVNTILLLHQDHIQTKGIHVTNSIPDTVHVHADPNHLRIIIRNILNNAIKFTPADGQVSIRTQERDDRVTIYIQDSGIGMEQSEIDRLFNPSLHFSKVGTGNEKGLGVGLLLTKEFLDKNDADVSIVSKPGEGTTFALTFKRA
jgi:two-component system sensor histidine kinase/response regulator